MKTTFHADSHQTVHSLEGPEREKGLKNQPEQIKVSKACHRRKTASSDRQRAFQISDARAIARVLDGGHLPIINLEPLHPG
jgi:hypothetical protein